MKEPYTFPVKEVTLEEMLQSRDERHQIQMRLIGENPDDTLVCLTVIMPGSIKRNETSHTVWREAQKALQPHFGLPVYTRSLSTGFESYFITSQPHSQAKKTACQIEDTHPLGRLFDIDVILKDGTPMTRTDVGDPTRKCLLCDNEARYCMRNHTHTLKEILTCIEEMVNAYVQRV